MRLFSEKVKPTFTSSDLNILTVESLEEVFFDVYEFEINGSKFIAEKRSQYKGAPVVNIPVVKGSKEWWDLQLQMNKLPSSRSGYMAAAAPVLAFGANFLDLAKPGTLTSRRLHERFFDDDPETIAYIQVKDLKSKNKNDVFVFNDWMFSSSPSIKPFDHPVYDIWLVKCY